MNKILLFVLFCLSSFVGNTQKTNLVIFNLETMDGTFSRDTYKEQSQNFEEVYGREEKLVLLVPERDKAHLAYGLSDCKLLLDSVPRFQGMTASPDWEEQLEQLLKFKGLEEALSNSDGVVVSILSSTYTTSIEKRSHKYARDLMLLLDLCEKGSIKSQHKIELRLAFSTSMEKRSELTELKPEK